MAKQKFKTGKQKTGGRKAGTPNKATKLSRDLITSLLEDEHEHLQAALKKLRTKSPKSYVFAIIQLMEFGLPKLSRTELTGEDGQPLFKAFNDVDTDKV